jgi:recombination protein RecA
MAKKQQLKLSDLVSQYSAEREEVLEPTGLRVIDDLIGGGVCPGSMYAIWGVQGSGKSTIALQIAKSYLRRGDKVMWIDVEKALNVNQQKAFGVRDFVLEGSLLHVTAATYAEADELTSAVAADDELNVKLVVIDSESMLLPKIGAEQSVTDAQPGQKARQCSLWLTKVKDSFYKKGIACIVLSHARANISMTANPYAPQEKIAGGFALKHIPDCIIQVQPGQKIGDKDKPEGQIVHIMAEKCKFAPPFRKFDFKLFFGTGIKKAVEIIDEAIAKGVIEQNGAFYALPDGSTIRGTINLYNCSTEQLRVIKSAL